MIDAYTHEKVMRVLTEAAKAGGMGPPSLRPGDRRIPWPIRSAALDKVLREYVEKHR